jgi:prepilin-type N-terminal cleavage/methylation domain-containing protein
MRMRRQLLRLSLSPNAAARRGMTLIEVAVALTVFAIVTVGVASFTAQVAKGSRMNGIASARAGALAAQVNRLEVLPFDSLPSRAGCTSVSSGYLPRTECISVEDVNARRRRVTFILRPNNTAFRPDTVIFERTRPAPFHPLNLF